MYEIEEKLSSTDNGQKLIICVGLPASGKSTFARNWVLEDPKKRVRVCRDDIRRQLGPSWIPTREKLVTKIEYSMVLYSLESGYSVIVDATNLNKKYYKWPVWLHKWKQDNTSFPEVELIENKSFLEISIEECIRRDSLRIGDEKVGEEVIRRMYENIQ